MVPGRTRAEGCLSDFALDALVAADLEGAEESRVRHHVATCEACAERVARTEAEQEAFAREAPPLAHGADRPHDVPDRTANVRRPYAARVGAATAFVALAATVLLFVGSRRGVDPEGERTKGHGRLGIVVKRGESTRTSAPEDAVSPGDRLRFRYTSTEPTYLAILGVDGARRAAIYLPPAATGLPGANAVRAERVEAGVDVALTTTLELDATPGTETFYAAFCDAPVALEPIRLALEAGREGPPPGCFFDRIVLRKALP